MMEFRLPFSTPRIPKGSTANSKVENRSESSWLKSHRRSANAVSSMAARKRLVKEWQSWDQKNPSSAMQAFGSFEEQRGLWKVKPRGGLTEAEIDYFTWEAELEVSSGPLQGASLVYSIDFPSDYPFKPPGMRPEFAGFQVLFPEIEKGWYVYMIPPKSTTGQRQKGIVIATADGEITVRWVDTEDDFDDEEPHGEVDVISSSFFDDQGPPVLGQSKDGIVYHPLMDAVGKICSCGIKNKWAPHFTILTCLAFLHAAVEDPNPEEGTKPVPPGSSNEMCFCTVNAAAGEDYRAGVTRWHQKARRRFFTEKGVVPLCVITTATEPGSMCIQCTSLAGTQLGELQIDSQKTVEDLEREIDDKIPMKEAGVAWKIVLPDGGCVSENLRYRSIGSVFGLH